MEPRATGVDRRDFLKMLSAGVATGLTLEASTDAVPASARPSAESSDRTTSDILVQTLIDWGVQFIFGVVGDGIGPLIEAIRKRQDHIRYIGVRHEEAAAFMASGFAKLTRKLCACVGTTGPGAIHLVNGLYDAALDGAPVIAITGLTFHDMLGMRYIQAVNTPALMEHVALLNVQVTGPRHAMIVGNRACRAAMGGRGVAHLAVPKDMQGMKLSEDRASMNNGDAATSSAWMPRSDAPAAETLRRAADLLNAGQRIALLVGQGAIEARAEVEKLADMLGAPVAKALLGRTVIPDDSPFTTGGIGHLGTGPSEWIMKNCDTLLIVGSTMPWYEFYPKPGQARAVQIDVKEDRIGLRYPVDVGLIGDARQTLGAMLPLLQTKTDRSFLSQAQQHVTDWNALMDRIESVARSPLRPQMVILKNNSLANVVFEQQEAGFGVFGCDLGPIDFVAFARSCGAEGFHCGTPAELRPALKAVFASAKAALIEVDVDPSEKPELPRNATV